MPLPDLTAIQVKALEATRTCPDEYCIYGMDRGMPSSKKCGTCKGTGLVYVLDPDGEFGLRVEHSCCIANAQGRHEGHCGMCLCGTDCPGYTPTDDMAAWMRAVNSLAPGGVYIRFEGPRKGERWNVLVDVESFECFVDDDIELAIYTAIATSVDRVMRHHEYS